MKVYLGNKKINRVYSGTKEIVTQEQSNLVDMDYVVVAGGGSGGAGGAGGGAGGAITGSIQLFIHPLVQKNTYNVTIGQGAPTSSAPQYSGSRGENSYFGNPNLFEATAIGGGGGGSFGSGSGWTPGVRSGSFGGSGGGGALTTGSRGLGTAGQGFDGGWLFGGGGGATSTGSNGTVSTVGNGGAGHYIWWNKYNSGRVADGGGCGGNNQFSAGVGPGAAGGASGGDGGNTIGISAPPNGGGGGGGGASSGNAPFIDYNSGAGGSGIVLLRYQGEQKAFGGEIYTTGSYTVHAFTSSGIFTI